MGKIPRLDGERKLTGFWVIGNWKMHGRLQVCKDLAYQMLAMTSQCPDPLHVAVAPALVHLDVVGSILKNSAILLAAQQASAHVDGAFTGQCSAAMLADLGVQLVLVGHSECRADLEQKDDVLRAQMQRIAEQGMSVVLCLGEDLAAHEAGQTVSVIDRQLDILRDWVDWSRLLVAYEPVWSIGTGKVANPEHIAAIHGHIHQRLQDLGDAGQVVPVLYGGSVKPALMPQLLALSSVNGVLVGGASLDADQFGQICKAVVDWPHVERA